MLYMSYSYFLRAFNLQAFIYFDGTSFYVLAYNHKSFNSNFCYHKDLVLIRLNIIHKNYPIFNYDKLWI